MASAKKIIAVIGATGKQGGAVMRAILGEVAKNEFVARAITRDISSEKAQAFKKMGAEIAQADATNVAALTEAIKGCYGMYCVTALPNDLDPEKEKEQAKCMAAAAKNAGIKHIVWSTLDDTRKLVPLESTSMPTLHGRFKVPHFDIKAESDQFFANLPTTYMLTSFFWDNFEIWSYKKGPDGKFYISIPMGKRLMPGIATEDIGKCVFGIFKRPDYIGKRVGIAGEAVTVSETAAKMSKALGKEIVYHEAGFDEFRGYAFPGAEEFGNMFQYFHDCEKEFCASRSVEESRKLNPELMTFDQWLAKNKNHIKLE